MMNNNKFLLFLLCSLLLIKSNAQDLQAFELTDSWLDTIASLAPEKPTVATNERKRILIFSLHTGYNHWVIPHTEAVMKLLATRTGIAECTTSMDIASFEKASLKNYDAIIMNNTCPERDHRNLFYDVLKADSTLTEAMRFDKAQQLENNLMEFVRKGGGLMLLHGGATVQNNSRQFSEMTGGSFDFHPKQQMIQVKLVDPAHPLVQAFKGKGFEHIDEPYFYKNAYDSYNFRPLLYMEADELEGLDHKIAVNKRYLAWIKRFGKGRIFQAAPSHNAQSYSNPALLQFFQDGMQYVLGQLDCDDSPVGKAPQ